MRGDSLEERHIISEVAVAVACAQFVQCIVACADECRNAGCRCMTMFSLTQECAVCAQLASHAVQVVVQGRMRAWEEHS